MNGISERSRTSTKGARPWVEMLEDRYLLSVIEATARIPAPVPTEGAAAFSSRTPANPAEDGSRSALRQRSGALDSAQGDTWDATTSKTGQGTSLVNNSSSAGEGETSAFSTAEYSVAPVNAATSGSARVAAADASVADESSQLGPGSGGSVLGLVAQGLAAGAGLTVALPAQWVANDPSSATGSAADAEADVANGAATGRDTRAGAPLVATAGWRVSMTNDASPAIPDHGRHASGCPALSSERGEASRPETLAAADAEIAQQEQPLASCAADLLVSFLPFDRARVEEAFDQVLGGLDALESGLSRLTTTANLIPGLTATAVMIAVMEVVHRRFGHRSSSDRRGANALEGSAGAETGGADADGDANFPGLPGWPHQWGLEVR
jgi:hypothetical protein